jgi:hypothetical protein
MGQSYKVAWAEIWDEVKDVFTNARITGQATMKDDDCLFMKRSGFLEETYFSWSIIPMVGADGTVTGLYNPAFEKVFSHSLFMQTLTRVMRVRCSPVYAHADASPDEAEDSRAKDVDLARSWRTNRDCTRRQGLLGASPLRFDRQ